MIFNPSAVPAGLQRNLTTSQIQRFVGVKTLLASHGLSGASFLMPSDLCLCQTFHVSCVSLFLDSSFRPAACVCMLLVCLYHTAWFSVLLYMDHTKPWRLYDKTSSFWRPCWNPVSSVTVLFRWVCCFGGVGAVIPQDCVLVDALPYRERHHVQVCVSDFWNSLLQRLPVIALSLGCSCWFVAGSILSPLDLYVNPLVNQIIKKKKQIK